MNRAEIFRPDWDEYFMAIAFVASRRSHDAQTQHGCVIVKDKKIVGVGYNGFPRDMEDDDLPNLRPTSEEQIGEPYEDKYIWMQHSERNAVANCELRPKGATAYVTGQCCFNCMANIYQHGVEEIVMYEGYGSHISDDVEVKQREVFQKKANIRVRYIKPAFNFINDIKVFPKQKGV